MRKILFLTFSMMLFFTAVHSADLTWEDCVKEALAGNYSLIAAKERLNQARAQSWTAISAAMPQVSASASGSKRGNEAGPGTVPYTGNTQSNSYSYGLSVRQLIFDGFANTQEIMKASENVKSAELNYKVASAAARFGLKQAYAGLMKAQKMVEITDTILTLRKKQYENVKLRYSAGRENKGAVLNSEADFKQAEFEAGQSVRSLETARQKLCSQLGRDINSDISVKEDYSITQDMSVEPDFEALFRDNPDILLAVSNRRAAELSFGAAMSSWFPQVSLSGSVGRSSSELWPQDTNWSLGVNISYTIFDGGRAVAQSSAALAALNQAKADEKAGLDNAKIAVKTAWYDFKDAYIGLGVQQKYFDASRERAKIADAQYSTGLIDFNNWTIIQNSLVSSQKSIISAQTGLLTAEAAWIQAKGGTLEDEK
jgi:outer membrane protein TolC